MIIYTKKDNHFLNLDAKFLIIKYICLFLLPIVHYCITKNLKIMKTLNFEQMEQINGGLKIRRKR